jgi:hypothetical protein
MRVASAVAASARAWAAAARCAACWASWPLSCAWFGLGGGNGLPGLLADELDLGGVRGAGFGEPVVGLAGPLGLGSQPRAHVLDCVVGVGEHLVGDGGAALGVGSSCHTDTVTWHYLPPHV